MSKDDPASQRKEASQAPTKLERVCNSLKQSLASLC